MTQASRDNGRPAQAWRARSAALFPWLALFGLVALALVFAYRRGQDSNWDLLNYHFFSGFMLMTGRWPQDLAPVGLQTFLNPLANVPSYLAFSRLPFPAGTGAIVLLQLTAIPFLALIARLVAREAGSPSRGLAEWLALLICLLAPLWWSELGTSFPDAMTAPLVLAGLYLGLRGLGGGEARRTVFFASGVLFGLACGMRLTHAPFAIAFLIAMTAASARDGWQLTLRRTGWALAGLVAGFALTAWWNVALLDRWGSPVFPLYNAWFKSPYFDAANFRDMRWHFDSLAHFGRFLRAAARTTDMTGEIPFADARLLVFVTLSIVVFTLRWKTLLRSKVTGALLLFLWSGLALWGVMLAYQRYLIPVELLLGIGIWILLARSGIGRFGVALLLAVCCVACFSLMRIPDWGHVKHHGAKGNLLGVALPAHLAATPGRYLVVAPPVGYLLPSLHPDSRFFGLGLSRQMDALIHAETVKPSPAPLRLLIGQQDAYTLWERLASPGWTPVDTRLSCQHFRSAVGAYVACDVANRNSAPLDDTLPIRIDFRNDELLPAGVLGVIGLSRAEVWGRWSDGETVGVQFANCLPRGRLEFALRGHAFGPNIGKGVQVSLDRAPVGEFAFGDDDRSISLQVNNDKSCANSLTFRIPHNTSPLALGLSADPRSLGIGLVSLGVRMLP